MIALTAGKPAPLGASYDGKGVNFALFSAHAERVELCVFDEQGNERRVDLPARSGDIWHGHAEGRTLKSGEIGHRLAGDQAARQRAPFGREGGALVNQVAD
ncbi:hypothetical protein LSR23_22005, partial [Klebsiella michiganensis]|nr:hypothetical protein [Klebsiella michiganensis]